MKGTEGRISRTLTGFSALLSVPVFAWLALAGAAEPLSVRLLSSSLAAVLTLGAYQSVERWLSPERGRRRVELLSDSALRRIAAVRRALRALFIAAAGAAAVLQLAGAPHRKGIATDLFILSALFLFMARCLAELVGAV